MAFYIGNRQQLDKALQLTRAGIGLFGEPFRSFTSRCELPPDIPDHIDAFWCIAEEPIVGEQCTTPTRSCHGGRTMAQDVDEAAAQQWLMVREMVASSAT